MLGIMGIGVPELIICLISLIVIGLPILIIVSLLSRDNSKAILVRCPKCNSPNTEEAKYCQMCGERITKEIYNEF